MATPLEENLFLCCQVSMASLRILDCLQLLRGLSVQEEKNESELPHPTYKVVQTFDFYFVFNI